jgi:hypothetical protein
LALNDVLGTLVALALRKSIGRETGVNSIVVIHDGLFEDQFTEACTHDLKEHTERLKRDVPLF